MTSAEILTKLKFIATDFGLDEMVSDLYEKQLKDLKAIIKELEGRGE